MVFASSSGQDERRGWQNNAITLQRFNRIRAPVSWIFVKHRNAELTSSRDGDPRRIVLLPPDPDLRFVCRRIVKSFRCAGNLALDGENGQAERGVLECVFKRAVHVAPLFVYFVLERHFGLLRVLLRDFLSARLFLFLVFLLAGVTLGSECRPEVFGRVEREFDFFVGDQLLEIPTRRN